MYKSIIKNVKLSIFTVWSNYRSHNMDIKICETLKLIEGKIEYYFLNAISKLEILCLYIHI